MREEKSHPLKGKSGFGVWPTRGVVAELISGSLMPPAANPPAAVGDLV